MFELKFLLLFDYIYKVNHNTQQFENVYYSLFSNNGTAYTQIGDFKSCSIHDILSDLSIYDDKLIFVGDGSVIHHDLIITLIKNLFLFGRQPHTTSSESINQRGVKK